MNLLRIISALTVGGVVGYITNWIAIKMLFRPLKPIMIGRFRVPFTPGIVPKRKDALAEILGGAIVDKFFNADDLEIVFKSDTFADAFADSVVSMLSDESFRLKSIQISSGTADSQLYARFRDELCIRIQAALLRADITKLISEEVVRIMEARSANSLVGNILHAELPGLITESLSDKLENYILNESRSVILHIIDDELNELRTAPIAEITNNLFPDPEELHDIVFKLHGRFMRRYVRHIVESIDVGGMITEKVKQMSAGEVEGLVLDVVNRELRYVVLLGAALGMLIGAINIFV
ncbi:Uncharacterized membrane protein YheB, UPF0754 family [Sporobacter termitidis DSM 10068]|uniref:Uncharacterized membrane protein YheB, UPF0754 family n=1 Tax=Sporobacter termitidis DSM 10068 TaxID=1123282 RepID=A0A1M5XV93_9FIRM|nr:DUF445 family protein [Sporobacter termitidis]SHI03720.1 Uncharacterized membrane protein YheB, UPF0754 family [Sporobacter termitidis DSM 10068]